MTGPVGKKETHGCLDVGRLRVEEFNAENALSISENENTQKNNSGIF